MFLMAVFLRSVSFVILGMAVPANPLLKYSTNHANQSSTAVVVVVDLAVARVVGLVVDVLLFDVEILSVTVVDLAVARVVI